MEPCLTATQLIRPPHYYGQFILARTKAQSVVFLFKEPCYYGQFSYVSVLTGFHCTCIVEGAVPSCFAYWTLNRAAWVWMLDSLCVVFLGKTLYSHSASLYPGVYFLNRENFLSRRWQQADFTDWQFSTCTFVIADCSSLKYKIYCIIIIFSRLFKKLLSRVLRHGSRKKLVMTGLLESECRIYGSPEANVFRFSLSKIPFPLILSHLENLTDFCKTV